MCTQEYSVCECFLTLYISCKIKQEDIPVNSIIIRRAPPHVVHLVQYTYTLIKPFLPPSCKIYSPDNNIHGRTNECYAYREQLTTLLMYQFYADSLPPTTTTMVYRAAACSAIAYRLK